MFHISVLQVWNQATFMPNCNLISRPEFWIIAPYTRAPTSDSIIVQALRQCELTESKQRTLPVNVLIPSQGLVQVKADARCPCAVTLRGAGRQAGIASRGADVIVPVAWASLRFTCLASKKEFSPSILRIGLRCPSVRTCSQGCHSRCSSHLRSMEPANKSLRRSLPNSAGRLCLWQLS